MPAGSEVDKNDKKKAKAAEEVKVEDSEQAEEDKKKADPTEAEKYFEKRDKWWAGN